MRILPSPELVLSVDLDARGEASELLGELTLELGLQGIPLVTGKVVE